MMSSYCFPDHDSRTGIIGAGGGVAEGDRCSAGTWTDIGYTNVSIQCPVKILNAKSRWFYDWKVDAILKSLSLNEFQIKWLYKGLVCRGDWLNYLSNGEHPKRLMSHIYIMNKAAKGWGTITCRISHNFLNTEAFSIKFGIHTKNWTLHRIINFLQWLKKIRLSIGCTPPNRGRHRQLSYSLKAQMKTMRDLIGCYWKQIIVERYQNI